MSFYNLLRKGIHIVGRDTKDRNYEKYSYTVNDDKEIEITVEAADLEAFGNKQADKDAKLTAIRKSLEQELTRHRLDSTLENPDFKVVLPNKIKITESGFSKLKGMARATTAAVTESAQPVFLYPGLKQAIETPDKIINLKFNQDHPEILTTIIKAITIDKDTHFSYVKNAEIQELFFFVKEEFLFLAPQLISLLNNAIIKIMNKQEGRSQPKSVNLKHQVIKISILPNDIASRSTSASQQNSHQGAALFEQALEHKNLVKNQDFIRSETFITIHESGLKKLLASRISRRFQQRKEMTQVDLPVTIDDTNLTWNLIQRENPDYGINFDQTNTVLIAGLLKYQQNSANSFSFEVTDYKSYNNEAILSNIDQYLDLSLENHTLRITTKVNTQNDQLPVRLTGIFASIATRADKIDKFADDGPIIQLFKSCRELAQLDGLYNQLLAAKNEIDIHKNYVFDTIAFWKRSTNSWQRLLENIREHAFEVIQLEANSKAENNIDDAISLLNEYKVKPLFCVHRSNNIFAWPFSTSTVDAIDDLIKDFNNQRARPVLANAD